MIDEISINLPHYELIPQDEFENMVINIIKENEIISSNVKAVQRYLDLCNSATPEDCRIDNCTSSLRKGVWEQLVKLEYVAF